ncbi:hypothetical protein D3C73_1321610 [compost metagenome]
MVSYVHQHRSVDQGFNRSVSIDRVLYFTDVLTLNHSLEVAFGWVETLGQRTHTKHSFQDHRISIVLSEVTHHVD